MYKISELRKKSRNELLELISEIKGKLLALRFENSTGQLKEVHLIKNSKKDIARIFTVLKEMELEKTTVKNKSIPVQKTKNETIKRVKPVIKTKPTVDKKVEEKIEEKVQKPQPKPIENKVVKKETTDSKAKKEAEKKARELEAKKRAKELEAEKQAKLEANENKKILLEQQRILKLMERNNSKSNSKNKIINIKGIGPVTKGYFNKMDVETIEDLLLLSKKSDDLKKIILGLPGPRGEREKTKNKKFNKFLLQANDFILEINKIEEEKIKLEKSLEKTNKSIKNNNQNKKESK